MVHNRQVRMRRTGFAAGINPRPAGDGRCRFRSARIAGVSPARRGAGQRCQWGIGIGTARRRSA